MLIQSKIHHSLLESKRSQDYISKELKDNFLRGMLRKLLAQHVHTIRRPNIDRFHDEQYRVRRDFDKILNSEDE